MTDKPLLHPEKDELVAFGLGKLEPDEATKIETHLGECVACCETLLDLKDDTFVGLVRKSPEPSYGDPTDERATLPPVHPPTEPNEETDLVQTHGLPGELREHSRYEVLELLGRGGMGDVYKAHHRMMNRPVALKLINGQLVQSDAAVKRFHREVQAAARLSHPNIVTAYDAEQAGDVHYLVMEFVDGMDLSEVVNKRGPLPIDEACDFIRQAAGGLEHAHQLGMVHRDIKPQNLMLDSGDNVKILDFGLANFATETAAAHDGDTVEDSEVRVPTHLTMTGSIMGTPDYISPEQAKDAHSADIRADIYSLGCTLYYLLTGEPPFTGDSILDKVMAHVEREPEAIGSVRVDVPDELAEVIRRMMAKDPAERFQCPADIADALAPFVDQHRRDDGVHGGADNRLPDAIAEPMRFAFGVLVAAGVLCISAAIVAISNRGWVAFQYPEWLSPWLLWGGAASLPVGAVTLLGATRIRRADSYWLVLGTVLLSMLPLNPAAIAMLPLTAGVLLCLRRPEIRAAFRPEQLALLPKSIARSRVPRIACLVGSSLIGIALLGVIIHFDTDHGEVIVEVDDPSLVVRISRDGREMRILEQGGTRITFLPSGGYDITVPGADHTVSVSPNRVQVFRGAKKFITIRSKTATATVSDRDRLQGKWVPVSGHMRTKAMTAEQLTNMSVTFEGNRVTLTDPDSGQPIPAGTFAIDAEHDPTHITLSAPDESETMPGIFQFDGDRLKLALIDEDYARPTDFSASDKPNHMTVVLERAPLMGPRLGETERDVLKAANEFLAVMDEGTFGQLYDMCASWAKRQTTRGKTSQTHQKIRDSFGTAVQRTLYRAHQIDQDLNLPKGRYAVVLYKSRFERQPVLWETLVLNVDTDGQWRVITYAWTLEPPTLPAPKTNDAPATTHKKKAALTSAQEWLKLVDGGKYGDAWEACAERTRRADNKQTLVTDYTRLFQSVGKLRSRELLTNKYTEVKGREFVEIRYDTQFIKSRVTEIAFLIRENDGEWRVEGYFHEARSDTPTPVGPNRE